MAIFFGLPASSCNPGRMSFKQKFLYSSKMLGVMTHSASHYQDAKLLVRKGDVKSSADQEHPTDFTAVNDSNQKGSRELLRGIQEVDCQEQTRLQIVIRKKTDASRGQVFELDGAE